MKNLSLPLMLLLLAAVATSYRQRRPEYVEEIVEQPSVTAATDNQWRPYGLNKTIELDYRQLVQVSYGITGQISGGGGAGHLVTRVLIDGVEKKEFRAITGNTAYIYNSANNKVLLKRGQHTISVQYRTPHAFTSNTAWDWGTAYLKVIY